MSFNSNIKKELCDLSVPKKQKDILLAGIIYGLKQNNLICTESEDFFQFAKKLLYKSSIYSVEQIKRKTRIYMIMSDEPLTSEADTDEILCGSDSNLGVFLRGVYLSCGVISDPNARYHLELSLPDKEKCGRLCSVINEHGIPMKLSSRNGQPFLYCKESESISDFMTYIGAMIGAMDIMNAKIVKDVRNNINRAVNCEAANIEKTVNAAQKQLDDIQLIIKKKGLDYLNDELRAAAEIRLNNPDISLNEIRKLITPAISRSGVYHRFEKISKIADGLRNGND